VLDGFMIVLIVALFRAKSTLGDFLKTLITSHPKKLLLYTSLFVGYCLIMTIEFSCRFYFKHLYESPYKESTYWSPSANIPDSTLGLKLPSDTVITHQYIVNDTVIYNRHYKIDSLGRRENPNVYPDSIYNQFAMVTGCSFAFGYGLDENNTLAYYLDSLLAYRGYNYGISGHGSQQTLAILQSRNLKTEIQQDNGILVYLFIDDHIRRLIGSRRLIKMWARNFPYYTLHGTNLKREGSFWTGRNMLSRLYLALSESAFINLFDIDIPWYTSNAHYELFGAVLREAQNEFLKQYPKGRFLVVIGPNSNLAKGAIKALEANQITYLNCSELLNKEEKKYKMHWTEKHPTKAYYLEVAEAVKTFINASK
ncbi:hypothetical protein ACFLR1_00495, partial [Bacteroidota bacterium]